MKKLSRRRARFAILAFWAGMALVIAGGCLDGQTLRPALPSLRLPRRAAPLEGQGRLHPLWPHRGIRRLTGP